MLVLVKLVEEQSSLIVAEKLCVQGTSKGIYSSIISSNQEEIKNISGLKFSLLTFRSKVVLDALLAWAHRVDSRHPKLVLDPLLQPADLLVVDVGVGDQDVRQLLLVDPAVAHSVGLQFTKGLGGSLPLKVHRDLVVGVHQPEVNLYNKCRFCSR